MERRFSSWERRPSFMICLMEARRSACSRSDMEVRREMARVAEVAEEEVVAEAAKVAAALLESVTLRSVVASKGSDVEW